LTYIQQNRAKNRATGNAVATLTKQGCSEEWFIREITVTF